MILICAGVGRRGKAQGKPFAATGWFAAGYLLAWSGFSLAATFLQWMIERAALLDSPMAIASNLLGAIMLIAAGVYQWTPLKDVCLAQCQSPFQFLMRNGGFRDDVRGCLLLGLRHRGYCVGCCWVLMALLFVGGVMNVLWIALLALLVLLEKLTPVGRWIARAAGIACVAASAWLLGYPVIRNDGECPGIPHHVTQRGWRWMRSISSPPSAMSGLIPCALAWSSEPKDWPWSSVRAHLSSRDDGVVTVAAVLERVGRFAEFVDQPFDEGAGFAPRASCGDDRTADRVARLAEAP
jgi:hypothetical protein